MMDGYDLDLAYRRLQEFLDRNPWEAGRAAAIARFVLDLPTDIRGTGFYLRELTPVFLPGVDRTAGQLPDPDHRNLLAKALRQLRSRGAPDRRLSERVDGLLSSLESAQAPDAPHHPAPASDDSTLGAASTPDAYTSTVLIPVVQEVPRFLAPHDPPDFVGTVLLVAARLRPAAMGERPDRWICHSESNHYQGLAALEDVSARAVSAALGAATRMMDKSVEGRVDSRAARRLKQLDHIGFDLHLPGSGLAVAGDSAALGLAVIMAGAFLGHARGRKGLRPNDRFAWTGLLGAAGEVLEVNRASIRAKTRAAFYAGLGGIVVPAAHLEDAKSAIQDLPGTFQVKGPSRLDHVLSDREALQEWPLPASLGREASARAGSGKRRVWAAVTVMALTLVGGIWGANHGNGWKIPFFSRRAVDSIVLQQEGYIRLLCALDEYQGVIWSLRPDKGEEFLACRDEIQGRLPMAILQTGDSGASQGVAVSVLPVEKDGYLRFLDAGNGEELWRRHLDLPGRSDESLGKLISPWQAAVSVGSPDRSLQQWPSEVLAAAVFEGPYWRTKVGFISPGNGLLASYLHPGNLYYYGNPDLDRDGQNEVILYGLSNAGVLRELANVELGDTRPSVIVLIDLPCETGQAYPWMYFGSIPPFASGAYLAILPLHTDFEPRVEHIEIVGVVDSPANLRVDLADGRRLGLTHQLEPIGCYMPESTGLAKALPLDVTTCLLVHGRGIEEPAIVEVPMRWRAE